MKKSLISINVFCIFILISCELLVLTDISTVKTVEIENVIYKKGFYGNLIPDNFTFKNGEYLIDSVLYRRVNNNKFNIVHCYRGEWTSGTLYCADEQWISANNYYKDYNNYFFICSVSNGYICEEDDKKIDLTAVIDHDKFDALITFAEKNDYGNLKQPKKSKTRRLPIPDSQSYFIFRESKDGLFTSPRYYQFYIIDNKLVLRYYYDRGTDLVVVDVPDHLGDYFIKLLGY
jgi:hypothetical protein